MRGVLGRGLFWVLFFSGVSLLLVLGLLPASVFAFDPPGGGGVSPNTNSSPTPVGGYTSFYYPNAPSACGPNGESYAMFACSGTGGACRATSPNLLCASDYSTVDIPSCAAPSTKAQWGYNATYHSCCTLAGQCPDNLILPTEPYVVGTSDSTFANSANGATDFDLRQSKIVHRNSTDVHQVVNSGNNPRIFSSFDDGKTWPDSFELRDLLTGSFFPGNESPLTVDILDPVLTRDQQGNIYVAFVVRGQTDQQTLYFSGCQEHDCSDETDWVRATPILNPLIDTNNGTWKHQYRAPKMMVDEADYLHVLFDDADENPSTRIAGIFHKFCDSFDACTGDWDNWYALPAGPDILQGGGNGFPRSPGLIRTRNGVLGAAWIDYSAVGESTYSIFFATLQNTLGTQPWSTPKVVGSIASPTTIPSLGAAGDSFYILFFENFLWKGFQCVNECAGSETWSTISTQFSTLPTPYIRNYAFIGSPSVADKWIVLHDGRTSTLYPRGIVGAERISGTTTVNHLVSVGLTDRYLAGVSDPLSLEEDSMVRFSGIEDTTASFSVSDILDFDNSAPTVTLTSPSAPELWQATPVGSALTRTISFTVSDSDAVDQLYYSVFLRNPSTGTDYPIGTISSLNALQGGSSPACAGTNFLLSRTCTIPVLVYTPDSHYPAPDGTYAVGVTVYDSAGAQITDVGSGLITLDASPLTITITSPSPSALISPDSTLSLDFTLRRLQFLNTISMRAAIAGTSTSVPIPITILPGPPPTTQPLDTCYNLGLLTWENAVCRLSLPDFASLDDEGNFDLVLYAVEDGVSNLGGTVSDVAFDFESPHIISSLPSGTVSSSPSLISFTVRDAHSPAVNSVSINGVSRTANCVPAGADISCTAPFPSSIPAGDVTVVLSLSDSQGNSGTDSFAFALTTGCVSGCTPPPGTGAGGDGESSEGSGGSGGGGGPLAGIVEQDDEGNFVIPGIGTIPAMVVDTFTNLSRAAMAVTDDLVQVTGPSASAIFLGLCTLAGLASDLVFRRIFSGIHSDVQQQRQRLVRTALAGVFFALPVLVHFQFSLSLGFVFAVMEVVGFLGASYVYKILQYYDTFGFKPISKPQ